jgi:hypothetical protein
LLKIGSYESYYCMHDEDGLFNIDILSREYGDDLWDVANEIMDRVDMVSSNTEEVVTAAYERFLRDNTDDKGDFWEIQPPLKTQEAC